MPIGEERGATSLPAPDAPSPARAFAGRAALIVGVASAVVALILLALGATLAFQIVKPFPVLALAAWTALHAKHPAARLIAYGLVASAAGDVLLEIKGAFIAGMVAFAAAHGAYIVAFVRDHRRLEPVALIPFLFWGVGLFFYIRPGLGPLTIPVAAYAVVLCVMMWRAAARYSIDRSRIALIGLAGAVLFGFSDSLIAVRLGGSFFSWMPPTILITYWIGQVGIAASFTAIAPNENRARLA